MRGMKARTISESRTRLELARRRLIDDAFAAMATDLDYQSEVGQIAVDFGVSDWQALRASENGTERDS
jgi:hypothetical protein